MIISSIREYIKSEIKKVDSDLRENNSPFFDNDIGETIIDRSYQVEFSNYTNNFRTEYREDSMDCTISIFGFGYREENKNFDYLFDKAICIRDAIVDIKNFSVDNFIVDVEATTIIPTRLNTDENGYKFDINLIFKIAYSRGDI